MTASASQVAEAARIARAIARWRVGHGLTANQADALVQTFDAAALSAADLSRRIGITTASMSRLLAGLERDGWIERAQDPTDARRTFVQASKRLAVAMDQLSTELAEPVVVVDDQGAHDADGFDDRQSG